MKDPPSRTRLNHNTGDNIPYSKEKRDICEFFPRDALLGHRRGKNPVAYVFISIFILPRSRKRQCLILIPRDALQGHRRGKNPVAYVFIFILFILPRSRKRQCLILIEV